MLTPSPRRGGVAHLRVAALESAVQPPHALLRRAVRERFRVHTAAGHLLDPVVADRGRRAQALLDVAGLEHVAPRGVMPQTPAKQSAWSSRRTEISFARSRSPRCCGARALVDAGEVLDVVADLVREHVGLREVAGCAEARAQIAVEREIDVHLLVGGAVERPHLALAGSARGMGRVAEQHEARVAIAGQQLRPGVLQVVEHERDELDQLLLLGARLERTRPAPDRRPDRSRRWFRGRRSSRTVGSMPSSHITAISATAPPRLMPPRPSGSGCRPPPSARRSSRSSLGPRRCHRMEGIRRAISGAARRESRSAAPLRASAQRAAAAPS